MRELGFFLGRFHVLALHLPIGIVIAAVALDWVALRPRYAALAAAAPFLWAAAAVSAVVTAALGLLHFGEGGFTGPSAEAHGFWGIVTTATAVLAWWLALRDAARVSILRLGAGLMMLALVAITGHYGGHLTHGTTYLSVRAAGLAAGSGVAGATPAAGATTNASADPAIIERLFAAGLLARQVAVDDAHLVVSVSSPGTPLGTAGLEALAAVTATLVDLNLGSSDLDDAELASIGALPATTHLRLARNRLTDGALPALRASPELAHLNLYGNAGVTDLGLDALADLPSLREVYVWQTGATAEGVARLRERRPDLRVDFGAEPTALPAAPTPR
jgi:uncharacterized membrane protein